MADAVNEEISENAVYVKSKKFAVRIVHLYQYLSEKSPKKEYVMSKQLLRSGTSIGANVSEAIYAQSPADFITKMTIALKEASETQYWIELLEMTDYLNSEQSQSMNKDCTELMKLLTSIVTSTKKNQLLQPPKPSRKNQKK